MRRYSRLEAIEFTLSCSDLMDLMHKAGHIPEGFMLDCDNPEQTDWPITLHVRRCELEAETLPITATEGGKP